jgi:transcription factor C subunit 7
MNWAVNPQTGEYLTNVPTPTGIPSDPALASYGETQAEQLGRHLETLNPAIDVVYSSAFYRCLQTIRPFVESQSWQSQAHGRTKVRCETGLGEWYGLARFTHPQPAPLEHLQRHFPRLLDNEYKVLCVPSTNGESIPQLHDRVAYSLYRVIQQADQEGVKSLLICTHAATMIAIGRALTGRMPEDPNDEDFNCFTCSLSQFERRGRAPLPEARADKIPEWQPQQQERIPNVGWRDGRGVAGGWDCVLNGNCDFLEGGEERGWSVDPFPYSFM